MQFFYKVSANLSARALKRGEKALQKVLEKQFKWSYDYLNNNWSLDMCFQKYLKAFKSKYKVKCIKSDSLLFNQLKSQFIGYKVYLQFNNDKSYASYLTCVKDVAKDLTNMKGE